MTESEEPSESVFECENCGAVEHLVDKPEACEWCGGEMAVAANVGHEEDEETTLVNVTEHGRSGVKMIGRSTKYGNPFKMKKHGGEYTREGCVEAFREYWYADEQADLREAASEELAGETLGCYCKPLPCHGDVIVEFLDTDGHVEEVDSEKRAVVVDGGGQETATGRPNPPDHAAQYIVDALDRQNPSMLRDLAEYANTLADWMETESEDTEDVPDEVEETDRPDDVPAKANIVTKEIDDNQYYYYQWWENGKTVSEYIGPVNQ